jgi:type VI secretion system secreted protein Hcp
VQAGSGGGAGRVHFDDFHMVKTVDKSSPLLLKACVQDQTVNGVVLGVGRPGPDGSMDFLTYTLSKALVSSCQMSDVNADGPTEDITFSYGGLTVKYQPQTPGDAPSDMPVYFVLKGKHGSTHSSSGASMGG